MYPAGRTFTGFSGTIDACVGHKRHCHWAEQCVAGQTVHVYKQHFFFFSWSRVYANGQISYIRTVGSGQTGVQHLHLWRCCKVTLHGLSMTDMQGFLTAVLQTHARKHGVAVDSLVFRSKVTKYMLPAEVPAPPKVRSAKADGTVCEAVQGIQAGSQLQYSQAPCHFPCASWS